MLLLFTKIWKFTVVSCYQTPNIYGPTGFQDLTLHRKDKHVCFILQMNSNDVKKWVGKQYMPCGKRHLSCQAIQ